MSEYSTQQFLAMNTDLTEEKIKNIPDDEILRNTFLSVFQHTKESSNLYVHLDSIRRINAVINDERPELVSVYFEDSKENIGKIKNGLHTYSLYCNLENNEPVLIGSRNAREFLENMHIISLLNCGSADIYHYNSKSLEKITKGSATIPYNRLQLYYFRQLFDTSREKANARMLSLTKEDYRDICL